MGGPPPLSGRAWGDLGGSDKDYLKGWCNDEKPNLKLRLKSHCTRRNLLRRSADCVRPTGSQEVQQVHRFTNSLSPGSNRFEPPRIPIRFFEEVW